MLYLAEVDIMPQKEILDPQGKAVMLGLNNLGLGSVSDVRIGKHIKLEIEASDDKQVLTLVENACKKLLANLIMEDYSIKISPKK